MNTIQMLLGDVSKARSLYLNVLSEVTERQGNWRPSPTVWNCAEITEHLFWAEQGGIFGMWKALHAIREGNLVHSYESNHKNMSIEEIILITWKPQEKVPEIAAPRMFGPLAFWKSSLASMQEVLEEFGRELRESELRIQAQHHPISGALDFHQRLEFIRFHIDRHREQVLKLIANMS